MRTIQNIYRDLTIFRFSLVTSKCFDHVYATEGCAVVVPSKLRPYDAKYIRTGC